MAGTLSWDVDTQYDFMRADGKLYLPDAEQIMPQLEQLTDQAYRAATHVTIDEIIDLSCESVL